MEDRRVLADLAAHPWHAPFAAVARELAPGTDVLAALNQLAKRSPSLRSAAAAQIHFVAPTSDSRSSARRYETTIFTTGRVATRPNRHDLLNALAWLAFPELKRVLNRCQSQEWHASAARPSARSAAADALTLLDENGVLFATDRPELRQALEARDWPTLFAPNFHRHCRVLVVGHGLADKLSCPYKAITAHALVLDGAPATLQTDGHAAFDRAAAQRITRLYEARTLSPLALDPLPLAGVPGWWPGQDGAFYADRTVFRPRSPRAPGRSVP